MSRSEQLLFLLIVFYHNTELLSPFSDYRFLSSESIFILSAYHYFIFSSLSLYAAGRNSFHKVLLSKEIEQNRGNQGDK